MENTKFLWQTENEVSSVENNIENPASDSMQYKP